MRGFAAVVALTVILLAGTVAGQYLKERLLLGGDSGVNNLLQVGDRDGWNSPSRFQVIIQKGWDNGVRLERPETTAFTSGNLKREADRAMSKVFDGYDTQWGKRFVYNEPSFVGTITIVEANSREIGVHLQISKSDYEIGLDFRDSERGAPKYLFQYTINKPEETSNVGKPGEHVFVLSSREELLLFGPPSPVPYTRYHVVKNPDSPLRDAISPSVGGVDLRFFSDRGIGGQRRVEEGGEKYRDSVSLFIDGMSYFGAGPAYSSRSTSSEDMDYVRSLTSKLSSSYSPVQATFIQRVTLQSDDGGSTGVDVDMQMIISVDASGRPAMILKIGKNRPTIHEGDTMYMSYTYHRFFPGAPDRGFKHERILYLGADFDRKSNIDQEGVWVFLIREDGTDIVEDGTPTEVETPSLYKFCSQDTVDALVEGDEVPKRSFLNLKKLGWTGKWRKKSLRYLRDWRMGTLLSHFGRPALENARNTQASINYELELNMPTYGDVELILRRLCLVSDPGAMEQIARDTTTAGLDASMSPEMALVLEYEVLQRRVPGNPKFIVEHVFASFPGRETIAIIANFPPAPIVEMQFFTYSRTQCSTNYRHISDLSTESSNTGVEGRFVVAYDGSRELGSVQPEGAKVTSFIGDCDDYAVPCDGECPAGYSCQVHGSKTLCVNCGNFLRVDKDAWPRACCQLNPKTNRCKDFFDTGVKKCKVENRDYFRVVDRRPMVFSVDTESVCDSPRHFKRNGGACVLKDTFKPNGNRKCYFHHRRAVP